MYNVLIRPLIEEDAVTSYRWRNDSDIWKFTGQRPDIEISQGIEFDWIRRVLNEYDSHRFAILADDIYVGNIQITNVVAEEGEYHIFIGEKDYWGKGIATLATQQLLRYAKKRLNLKRVYLVVNPLNTPAIRVYEKCGFIRVSDEIKMVFDLSQNLKPTVSVFMMTYNHEAYIRQAVESILCQKT
ncbi:MAG: GNAT family N-acetyltransferase, partial [Bacteroidales bacterium]|nr:GNAT family N-acetyltransferase [Bacteroidales bacterium]